MSASEEHWLQKYVPTVENDKLVDILHNPDKKREVIDKLCNALGAEFYQYVASPNDYSGKKGQFVPRGAGDPILFLPTDLCNQIGFELEHKIERLFFLRIKYVDEPVQL